MKDIEEELDKTMAKIDELGKEQEELINIFKLYIEGLKEWRTAGYKTKPKKLEDFSRMLKEKGIDSIGLPPKLEMIESELNKLFFKAEKLEREAKEETISCPQCHGLSGKIVRIRYEGELVEKFERCPFCDGIGRFNAQELRDC